jgi:hygromycin-B 4-O-kinase
MMLVAESEVDDFMAGHFAGRAADVRPLAVGEWSRAFAFVLDGRQAVIRFGDHVSDFRKDQVMAARSSAALPVPAVLEIGSAGDGYFAVSERARGEPLDDLDRAGMQAVLPRLLAALDAMREMSLPAARGYGMWAPDGTAPAGSWAESLLAVNQETARVPGWRAALAHSPVGAAPFDRAYARLRQLAQGLPDERHMIHRDLLSRNVFVQGADITAVIDWGNATYGDWLYDAAWLIHWWPRFPQWRDIDIAAELERHWRRQGTPVPDLHRRLEAYLLHIGLDLMSYAAYRRRWDDLSRIAGQISRRPVEAVAG